MPIASTTTRRQRYKGVRELSQRGTHEVIIYEVPNSPLAYVFQYLRKTATETIATYQCRHCKKEKKYTAVLVSDDELLEDPTRLGHMCIPVERTKDKTERLSYETTQNIRKNPEASIIPTINYWLKVVDNIENMTWGDVQKRLAVLLHYFKKGYKSRSSAYTRSVKRSLGDVDMDNVPEMLQILSNGSRFLQFQQPNMHIYMCDDIVKIPLLYAIMRHKREDDYLVIFEKVKSSLQVSDSYTQETEIQMRLPSTLQEERSAAQCRVAPGT
ncbi:unnamed protein product [Strongylus vulgaris]|uniref:Uncharacterized protein n=1 Tax=Strongylus vulgaris TaxID=40348 RepID=A0A3P7JBL9_STRVU|nr:unnamed protein product [Strongylus vulgaris]